MENNNQNKATFFGQYYGQNIMDDSFNKVEFVNMNDDFIKTAFLNLKPLSKISEEDAIKLVKLKFHYDKGDVDDILSMDVSISSDAKGFFLSLEAVIKHKKWSDFVERVFIGEDKCYSFYIDYLRSKGYLVPYLEYSIDDLINLGWVKIV